MRLTDFFSKILFKSQNSFFVVMQPETNITTKQNKKKQRKFHFTIVIRVGKQQIFRLQSTIFLYLLQTIIVIYLVNWYLSLKPFIHDM